MIEQILVPVVSLGGMGLIFGSLLAYASQKFAVETDERITAIMEVLPGVNCGGCGYAGCGGLAAAIIEGKSGVNGCPVGGTACATSISEIMGIKFENIERKIARVLCNGTSQVAKEKYEYYGIEDCVAASKLGEGNKGCSYGCLGLGTCVRACQFDAIIIEDGIAAIDPKKCTSCGQCAKSCPKKVIELIPESQETWVICKSKDKGPVVRNLCSVGCISCKICEKTCKYDAIHVIENIAVINYDKCVNCAECVMKCPKNIIHGRNDLKNSEVEDINELI